METVETVARLLDSLAPVHLAEEWDNVGLLVGHRERPVRKIMTCLTITPASASEAVDEAVDMIVAHHPLPFHALRRLTDETIEGRLLLQLLGQGVAIYSPHTAHDRRLGINRRLADWLGLTDIEPIVPAADDPQLGSGRWGRLAAPISLVELARRAKSFLSLDTLRVVGQDDQSVSRIAVACGSGGQLLPPACALNCDAFVTGEASFHTCLEAEARGIGLILTGHFASERFAVESLAEVLSGRLADVTAWASRREQDPLRTI